MRVFNDLNGDTRDFHGGVVTIGKFDGLHLGHQELLKQVSRGPKPAVVLTFDPHPIQVLQPEKGLTKIFPKEDLAEQLPCYGIEGLGVIAFSLEVAAQSAATFAENTLWKPFQPKRLVVGYDFAFGHKREGNIDWLKKWCADRKIAITIVAPLENGGAPVSSRRVRELIVNGDVKSARELLGRPFYLRGVVVKGAGRGKSIGFPTLNLQVSNETLPGLGVYATRTKIGDRVYGSVTNVGRVPTFTDQSRVHVETHLLNQSLEAYGAKIDVEFLRRLRPEKKFASAADLKKQIEQDILEANEEVDLHKPDK